MTQKKTLPAVAEAATGPEVAPVPAPAPAPAPAPSGWSVLEIERAAHIVAASNLFGVKRMEEAFTLMWVAQGEGLHPARAFLEYYVVDGRPALRADAMLARFLRAGGRVEWHALTDEVAEATFSHPAGGTVRIRWTIQDAKRAGLLERKSPANAWLRYPRAMLRARVVSEGIRTVFPVNVGLYTPEEVVDMGAVEAAPYEPAPEPRGAVGDATPPAQPLPSAPTTPRHRPPSKEQVDALKALMSSLGLTKEELREVAARFVGRSVQGVLELAREEAEGLIAYLEALLEAGGEQTGQRLKEWLAALGGLPEPTDLENGAEEEAAEEEVEG